MRLAFFDLDLTLLSVNSGSLWIRRELALGHIGKRQALRAGLWLTRYQLGFASAEDVVAEAVSQITGTHAAGVKARTETFWHSELRHLLRAGALAAVEQHRSAGDRLVMLTSSTNYLADLAAAELKFDAVLCNRLEIGPDGRHTGRVDGRICFGEGKLAHARLEAGKSNAAVERAVFYTDSFSDLPVLEAVEVPVAVNPDPRLKRHALKKGWRVVDWGGPAQR